MKAREGVMLRASGEHGRRDVGTGGSGAEEGRCRAPGVGRAWPSGRRDNGARGSGADERKYGIPGNQASLAGEMARHRRRWQRRRRVAVMRPRWRASLASGALGHRAHIAEAAERSCYIPDIGRNLAIGMAKHRARAAMVQASGGSACHVSDEHGHWVAWPSGACRRGAGGWRFYISDRR